MGQKAAREKWVTDEFKALIQAKKDHGVSSREYIVKKDNVEVEFLTLSDIQKFKQPRNRDIMLDPNHLGTIFVLDNSKEGRFYLKDIQKFADLYFERQANNPNIVDIVKEFQGYCTLTLWNYVMFSQGTEKFVKWFGRVFSYGNTVKIHGQDRRKVFVDRRALKILDEVFSVSKTYGVDQTHSFNLMQAVARQQGQMPSESKTKYKDVIPREILEEFGREFIDGFIKYMTDLGFEPNIEIH